MAGQQLAGVDKAVVNLAVKVAKDDVRVRKAERSQKTQPFSIAQKDLWAKFVNVVL